MTLPIADVARSGAHRYRGVVRRAAAERLGARGENLRGRSTAAGGVTPFVLGIGRHMRGVQQVVWIAIHAIGPACFEQQDRTGWIFAQTAGEDSARRTSPDNDYVSATAIGSGHRFRSP